MRPTVRVVHLIGSLQVNAIGAVRIQCQNTDLTWISILGRWVPNSGRSGDGRQIWNIYDTQKRRRHICCRRNRYAVPGDRDLWRNPLQFSAADIASKEICGNCNPLLIRGTKRGCRCEGRRVRRRLESLFLQEGLAIIPRTTRKNGGWDEHHCKNDSHIAPVIRAERTP